MVAWATLHHSGYRFFEPNWETGKHIPWRFRRTDDELWGLAGMWNTWTDKASGQIHESFTLLTINADHHPIMSRMHRPDRTRPADMQDKRSVIAIELEDVNSWLYGTQEEARALLRTPAQDAGVARMEPAALGQATATEALAGSLALHVRRRRRSKRSDEDSDLGALLSYRSGATRWLLPPVHATRTRASLSTYTLVRNASPPRTRLTSRDPCAV